MSKTFRPWTIDQPLLLPASVRDFVGEGHLARLVLALVLESVDLGEIEASDEIDKQFLRQRAIYGERERPRGEARRVGCKRRQASYSFLAGLRRSRAWPFGGRGRQASTKCW